VETEFHYRFMWDQYTVLERELEEVLNLLPPHKQNLHAWSPKLGFLLMNVCSILNSLFKAAQKHSEFQKHDGLKIHWNKKNPDYSNFQPLFETVYQLSTKPVYFLPLWYKTIIGDSDIEVIRPIECYPYRNWSPNQPPDWWTWHNKLKHDWLNFKEKGTLKETLRGFAGTFMVFVQFLDTRIVLIDADVIRLGGGFMKDVIKHDYGGLEPLPFGQTLAAKSKLFGYIFETEGCRQRFPSRVFGPDSFHF